MEQSSKYKAQLEAYMASISIQGKYKIPRKSNITPKKKKRKKTKRTHR